MPTASGDPDEVVLGVGWLYVAPIDTADPTVASAALPSAWRCLGYTEEGSTFTMERSFDDIEVAEELEPIDSVNNKTVNMIAAQLAQATRKNLAFALDGTANDTDSNLTPLEPPAPGEEQFFKMVWDKKASPSDTTNVRWLWRRCKVTGNIEMAHQKSPAKTLLPVEIKSLKPSDAKSWKCFPDANGLIS